MKPEQKTTEKTLHILKKGGVILYPTDTVWGIGCDATNEEAVKKIFSLKKRPSSKAMICLVSDFNMLKKYVNSIPNDVYTLLKNATKPTTIIYNNPIGIAQNLIAHDNTLAFRVVEKGFAHDLIKVFNKPLVSTSANTSGEPTPTCFKEIDSVILEGVEYIVPLQQDKKSSNPSSIIKIETNGKITVIRE